MDNGEIRDLAEHLEDLAGEIDDIKDDLSDILEEMEEESSESALCDQQDGSGSLYKSIKAAYEYLEKTYTSLNEALETIA